MSLQPATYEEAQAAFKPLKRTRMARKASLRPKSALRLRKRKARPKRKRLSVGKLKKKVWKEFSIYIRANNATRDLGLERCVTCGEVRHWKELQAGHFIRGRLNSNLFDERGCHPQCHRCNIHFQGNVVAYYKFMLEKYGQDVIDELLRQNDQTHKWLPGQLEDLLVMYRERNANNPLTREPI